MRRVRPLALIRLELDCALDYRQSYVDRPTSDRWTLMMREDNERDIQRLEDELRAALGRDLDSPA